MVNSELMWSPWLRLGFLPGPTRLEITFRTSPCHKFVGLSRRAQRMSTVKFAPSATAISATVKRFSTAGVFVSRVNATGLGLRARNLRAISSKLSEPLEVCAKESLTSPDKLGDCPFTQRVLLTLEEKSLPYDLKLVDFRNKPEWFLKISPEGKVPIIKLDEEWIPDSDIITQKLEEKFPEPSLATPPEKASVGSKIFSTFIGFLKSKDPKDGTEGALLNELTAFNGYLVENGPFINGGVISAADLSLAPKLYHLQIALEHYKNWSIPDSLTYVQSYMKNIFSSGSFIKTQAQVQDVIEGWRPKVEG